MTYGIEYIKKVWSLKNKNLVFNFSSVRNTVCMDLVEILSSTILSLLADNPSSCVLEVISNFAYEKEEISGIVFDMKLNHINIKLKWFNLETLQICRVFIFLLIFSLILI